MADAPGPGGPDEPLELSAPLAWRLAGQLCRGDIGRDSCFLEHRPWQYLRLLGLATSASLHGEFYQNALRAAPPHCRVLVSGTADYAVLAQLIFAARASGKQAEVTVLDRCAMPLELNRWYAERMQFPIQTRQADILAFDSDPFDLICTHAFIGYFAPADRPSLFEKWRLLLAPNGRLVTVHRLRPEDRNGPVAFAPDQVLAFRQAVLERALQLRTSLAVEPENLAEAAGAFASRQRMHPLHSIEELKALAENAGLMLREATLARLPPERRFAARAGPGIPSGAEYALITLERG